MLPAYRILTFYYMKQIIEQLFFSATLALSVIAFSVNLKAAVYTVTNTSDGGAGSLRAAIAAANATVDDDTINFNFPANDPHCTGGDVCTINLITGEFTLDSTSTAGKLTIFNGGGASKLLLDGNNTSRIFYVSSGAEVILNGVTVTGGNGTGITDGTFDGAGGGIENQGKLTVINSVVSGNSAADFGGGIDNYIGILTLTNSVVGNNSAGGGIGAGGGITNYCEENSVATILSVTNSSINNNSAVNFGGILNNCYATLTNSTVSGNTVQGFGGGIENQSLPIPKSLALMKIISSTISGNTANSGGGIHNYNSAVLEITNSTISSNTANSGDGGGIFNDISELTILNSTFTGNRATNGGGINNWNNASTQLNIRNTIVAANSATNGQPDVYHGSSDTFISNGNNLIGNTADTNAAVGWQISDILNQTPLLGLLGNYGGATQTHALLSGSPAINAGNNCVLTVNGCGDNNPALPTDQRGAARNGTIDIGAYEYAAPTATNVSVNGRVTNSSGRGLFNETVVLTVADGSLQYARTNGGGYYHFSNIAAGATVILSVNSKRYQFAAQIVALTGDETINFVALR